MRMKNSPSPKVPKKRPPYKGAEPEQEHAPSAPKRPRGYGGPLALALVTALTTAMVLAAAVVKATPPEPKRAPCPCICAKA